MKSIIILILSSLSKVIQKLIYTKKFLKKNLFPPKRIHVNAFGTYCYDMFKKEELEKCYNHFKKHFYNAVFLENTKVPEYAIDEAIKIEEKYNDNGLYLEFGVFKGNSINLFAKKNKKSGFGWRALPPSIIHCGGPILKKKRKPEFSKNPKIFKKRSKIRGFPRIF